MPKFHFLPVASLFVLSFALIVGCDTAAPEGGSTTTVVPGTASTDTANGATLTGVSYQAGDTITVNVPEMHCPFYCYPKVEETLTELGGIEGIKLVEQKAKDKIDDPRMVIKLSENFDWDTAVKALDEVGFAGATASLNK